MSAAWDREALLRPLSESQPCGQNLEDTPELASFDAYRVFGQTEPPDQRPDSEWRQVRDRSLDTLQKSKDIRLLTHLAAALLRTDGLPAFCETLGAASGWLEAYWAETYPPVEEDAILRRNSLNCLADPVAVIDGVRRAPLIQSREHGRISLRDIDLSTGQAKVPAGETPPDEGRIRAGFEAMPLETLQGLGTAIETGLAALKSIDAKMRGECGYEAAPAIEPLAAQLGKIGRILKPYLDARAVVDNAAPGPDGDAPAPAGAVAVGAPGAIRSRDDAIRALDAVSEYFRKSEPSSPVPLFVERAKRLVAKDFFSVLAEVAPQSVQQARDAVGLKDE